MFANVRKMFANFSERVERDIASINVRFSNVRNVRNVRNKKGEKKNQFCLLF